MASGEHFVRVAISVGSNEQAIGLKVMDQIVMVSPGEKKEFRFHMPSGQTSTSIPVYSREGKVVGHIKVEL